LRQQEISNQLELRDLLGQEFGLQLEEDDACKCFERLDSVSSQ
jgi:hypothetical protein